MKKSILSLVLFVAAIYLSAQQSGDPVSIGTYQSIYSDIMQEERPYLLHLPEGYEETTQRYPVLYILYGNQVDEYFAEAVMVTERLSSSGVIPPVIIVGVANTDRYRDNLPVAAGPRNEGGGADWFLDFFAQEMIPHIDSAFRTKDFRILAGPQAGAVLALYALVTRPQPFQAYFTENPFMNPGNAEYLFPRAEKFFEETKQLNRLLYILCENNEPAAQLAYVKKLDALLEKNKPEQFRYTLEIREPSGYFVPPLPFREGFLALFEGYKLPDEMEVKGVGEIIDWYRIFSEKIGFTVEPPVLMMTLQTGKLMGSGNFPAAIGVAEFQLELYPDNLNALWQLGEIHRHMQDYEKAAGYYRRFLEIRDTDVSMVERRLEEVEKLLKKK